MRHHFEEMTLVIVPDDQALLLNGGDMALDNVSGGSISFEVQDVRRSCREANYVFPFFETLPQLFGF